MSTPDPTPGTEAGQAGAQPDEAQLRAAYEAELSRITSVDMVLQAAASLLNIGAYRLGLTGDPAQRESADRATDLEQVRDAIDAVRGLMGVIERSAPNELRPLRDALSQLQMAYTRAVQAGGAAAGSADKPAEPSAASTEPGAGTAAGGQAQQEKASGPGPAEASGRLWVPGR
jgi:hypothetical protein